MEFIGKARNANRFKAFIDITEIESKDFETYEIFKVEQISIGKYDSLVKQKKIEMLKGELSNLGFDIDSLIDQKVKEVVTKNVHPSSVVESGGEIVKNVTDGLPVSNKVFEEETPVVVNENNEVIQGVKRITEEEKMSSPSRVVKNKQTGEKFTLGELRQQFMVFKDKVEKDIPEIIFSSFDEDGFVITVTDIRNDMPKLLPNGIPLRQVRG